MSTDQDKAPAAQAVSPASPAPSPDDAPHLQQTQHNWATWLRAPDASPRPSGEHADRMDVYAQLLRNNVTSAIQQCFPVCRQLIAPDRWQALIEAFFREASWHQSPVFQDIPKAFVEFLQAESARPDVVEHMTRAQAPESESAHAPHRHPHAQSEEAAQQPASAPMRGQSSPAPQMHALAQAPMPAQEPLPPWLAELAHYEWLELAVDTAPDQPPQYGPQGLALNPICRLEGYEWPVHTIGPDKLPAQPATTFVAVFRTPHHQVRFSLLTPASAQLLALLQENGCDWQQAVHALAVQWNMDADTIAAQIQPLQTQWLADGLLMVNR